jgi:hypothetical protein
MKRIAELCPRTKIRLRGQGSGFREGTHNVEALVALQINVSSSNDDEYDIAKKEVTQLLEGIYKEYGEVTGKDQKITISEHPRNPKK